VYNLKSIDIFLLVVCVFLAVGSEEKGCQGINYLSWRVRAAKITLLLKGCQDNLFTWQWRAAKVTPLLNGRGLPRKTIKLVVR